MMTDIEHVKSTDSLSIGVDVGGTNTDAVVLDESNRVLVATKQSTTDDVTGGIRAALAAVLDELGMERQRVTRVMMGTTHATNAIVGRRGLGRVAVIRLGAPATTGFTPLTGWPSDLRARTLAGDAILPGGHMVDGTPISAVDAEAIRQFLDGLEGPIDAVAICGVFSPSFPEQEGEVEDIVRSHLGGSVPVSLSHEIGAIGMVERENATVLNASLNGVAKNVSHGLMTVVQEEGLDGASVFFAQNDGTLMALEFAIRFPVLTIGSGPANSIRGAALLSGVDNAIVVDVGGTTSDLGVIVGGFPRESTMPREIGGVRTNFRMPDIVSIGVGGGTRVNIGEGTIGPGSVGHRLQQEALLFGGDCATLTDAVVHAGVVGESFGGRALRGLSPCLEKSLEAGLEIAHDRLAEAVERLSHGKLDQPLVVVGGGGALVPEDLPGVATVLHPDHGGVANAVGAAVSLVGGRAQRISGYEDRQQVLESASRDAIERAIEAGADPLHVQIIDVVETPVSYSAEQSIRVSVKAAGPLARLGANATHPATPH